jgi:hypothetical protein
MTDEQLDAALEALRELLAQRAGAAANVIEGTAGLWRSRIPRQPMSSVMRLSMLCARYSRRAPAMTPR